MIGFTKDVTVRFVFMSKETDEIHGRVNLPMGKTNVYN